MFLQALPQEESTEGSPCAWNGGQVGELSARDPERVNRAVRCSLLRPVLLLVACGEDVPEFAASAAAHPSLNYWALRHPPPGLCTSLGLPAAASDVLVLSSSDDNDAVPSAFPAGLPALPEPAARSARLRQLARLAEPAYVAPGVETLVQGAAGAPCPAPGAPPCSGDGEQTCAAAATAWEDGADSADGANGADGARLQRSRHGWLEMRCVISARVRLTRHPPPPRRPPPEHRAAFAMGGRARVSRPLACAPRATPHAPRAQRPCCGPRSSAAPSSPRPHSYTTTQPSRPCARTARARTRARSSTRSRRAHSGGRPTTTTLRTKDCTPRWTTCGGWTG